jgi:hypothetical protein
MGLPKSFIPPKEAPKYRIKNPELRKLLDDRDQTVQLPPVPQGPTQLDYIIRFRRVSYRGHIGETIAVVGPAIHSASVAGVTLVPPEPGSWGILRTIPWHRILEFDTHPQDPIRNGTF